MSYKENEEHNCIEIVYESSTLYKNKIRIFGELFVKNNKEKCKFLYKDKVYQLKEYFEKKNNENYKDLIKIKLIGINNITNMSYMFYECSALKSFLSYFNISLNSIFA